MQRKMMDRLIEWKKEKIRKPLLLKGTRQVGKTHLLKEFGIQYFSQFHYFDFEKEPFLGKIFEPDLNPRRILDHLSLHTHKPIHIGKDLIIFDEIQAIPKALTSLKYFCEECPKLHLCGASSLLGLHPNSATFPVGKATFETLRPMSFEEFLMASQDKGLSVIQKLSSQGEISELQCSYLWDQLKRYFIVGGLPEAVSIYCEYKDTPFEAFSRVRKKQDDLLTAYYPDIVRYSGKVNASHIDRVLQSIPEQLNPSHKNPITRFKFRGIIPGVVHYARLASAIDWLETAGLIIKTKTYRKENSFKLFLFDVGLLGSMSHLSPTTILEADHRNLKGLIENFAAQGEENLINWLSSKKMITLCG